MKTCSRCGEEKQFSEFTVRSASHDGLTPSCTACLNASKRAKYAADPEERSATIQRVKRNEKKRCAADPAFRSSWTVWRHLKSLRRVPGWVKHTRDILPIYRAARAKGPDWVVDHIIPLNGETVCGLHVPGNLRIVTTFENNSKGRSFIPELLHLFEPHSE